jgi:hypothetical protein
LPILVTLMMDAKRRHITEDVILQWQQCATFRFGCERWHCMKLTYRTRPSDVAGAHVRPTGVTPAPWNFRRKRRHHVVHGIGHDDVIVYTDD